MLEYLVLSLLYGLPLYCILRQHSTMSSEDRVIVAGLFGLCHGFLVDPYDNIPLFAAFFNIYSAYGTILGVLIFFDCFGGDEKDDDSNLEVPSEPKDKDPIEPANWLK